LCGAEEPLPASCARCGFQVKPVGQCTERVEDTLQRMFPHAPLVRLDRDSARSAADVEAVMHTLLDGRAQILVGTQMVTKGHHFPAVTLVVVLNADQGLFSSDFRSAERLAQTIVQVAGHAGRAEPAGEVLLQTEYPDHPLLQQLLAGGYEAFAAGALEERRAARWPPFWRIALLRASATGAAAAHDSLGQARATAGKPDGIKLLGPVNAAIARRAGRHHAQLLIESASRTRLQAFLGPWLAAIAQLPAAGRVRWAIDVDPLETQ
jgi:primosomal protein N' (replication factor Y)